MKYITLSLSIAAYGLWRSALACPSVTLYTLAVVTSLLTLASLVVTLLPSDYFDYTENK